MNYKDYKELKVGSFCSVGMFEDKIYAFRHIGGPFSHSEYYAISKEEYDLFPYNEYELSMFHFEKEIKLCSDYVGDTEFDENEIISKEELI
jgi:hypothetical protein